MSIKSRTFFLKSDVESDIRLMQLLQYNSIPPDDLSGYELGGAL